MINFIYRLNLAKSGVTMPKEFELRAEESDEEEENVDEDNDDDSLDDEEE